MTAPAFEEVPMPEPFATLHDDGYWTMPPGKVPHAANYAGWREHVYTADQLRAYGDQRANAALEEAARACEAEAEGDWLLNNFQAEMASEQCAKAIRALKKENGDA